MDSSSKHQPVVIVGGGQAGFQVAASLRQAGFAEPLLIISDENHLPYQRPPLSKSYLNDGAAPESLHFRPQEFLESNRIDFENSTLVQAIDRQAGKIVTSKGKNRSFSRLVIATGSRNRALQVPGAQLKGVVGLRTIADAEYVRSLLLDAEDVVIVGAGFVGLELASHSAKRGHRVTVVEAAERAMQRVASPQVSAVFARAHAQNGVMFRFRSGVVKLLGEAGHVSAVECDNGDIIRADLVLVGIGVIPNTELAAEAGLPVNNGIVVDERLRTADPRISAIGDCANHPSRFALNSVRIESVQNATDQARHVALSLSNGTDEPYAAVPWFWSEQGKLRLQIVGLSHGVDHWVMRGEPDSHAFSVFGYRGSKLAVVESVGRPADHVLARRLIGADIDVPPEMAADPSRDIKSLAWLAT
ncbi:MULTISPECIES: FAD-dependent oxidoreductase [unclassified Chelatococcus]|uniref:NAD(P)/FAD-dependent oxidoreductase n=1 Tax=unclassified Chelatococcus TaxID=2638111 RepID=UPI001BD14793|nr:MULTISPECIES: FAD-dependent oxidoreductase [unclassified Chelatococcus]MBX3321267.1 FAD-dependent oxidoreductase [Nitrospira sp.]CAH1662273.1 Rhodocoxin reductase [Hyphomicrobiales bacterium]MBS7743511.1 FAD-dependent oxidoreductase [Chelatococcus sp. HY11]MBX3547381.1 FAD-dependent oxidoreductase [Chelatococcus sp.]CAH1687504.1 Rhodocoxin reductase [Hyphomicrobiales bacterium]